MTCEGGLLATQVMLLQCITLPTGSAAGRGIPSCAAARPLAGAEAGPLACAEAGPLACAEAGPLAGAEAGPLAGAEAGTFLAVCLSCVLGTSSSE